jgi:hypothetical protein
MLHWNARPAAATGYVAGSLLIAVPPMQAGCHIYKGACGASSPQDPYINPGERVTGALPQQPHLPRTGRSS